MTQLLEALKKFYVNQRVPKHGLVYSGAASFFWSFFVFQSQAIVWKVEQCILCNPGYHRRNPSPGLSVALVYSALGESNSLHWPVNHAVPMAGR